jgi:hypothetical protein
MLAWMLAGICVSMPSPNATKSEQGVWDAQSELEVDLFR